MNFPLFIARRIYSDHIGDQQKVSKPAIRIAYVLKKEDLERALIVLRKALEAYPGRVVAKE